MISEICPNEVEEEPASGLPHFVDEDSIESEVEDKEQSMFGKRKSITGMYIMTFMWNKIHLYNRPQPINEILPSNHDIHVHVVMPILMNNLLLYGFPYFYTLIRASLYVNL